MTAVSMQIEVEDTTTTTTYDVVIEDGTTGNREKRGRRGRR